MSITVFLIAAAGSFLLTPLVIRLACVLHLVDAPGLRKIHKHPIPRLGGVGIVASTMLGLLGAVAMFEADVLDWPSLVLLGGGVIVFLVGIADDIRPVPARLKLLAQLGAATAICACGIRIDTLTIDSWTVDLGVWAWPLTILWIVGLTNAVNLIDGLDGLAGGIAMLATLSLAVCAGRHDQLTVMWLALALAGGLSGFLWNNFNPARIFLGDGGTYFVGFVISGAAVLTAERGGTSVDLALIALVFGIPIFDTLLSMLRRMQDRRSLMAPDRGHIHHRLLAAGLTQRQVTLMLYTVTAAEGLMGQFMFWTSGIATLLTFGCLLILLLVVFHLAGSFDLQKLVKALKRNRFIGRSVRLERRAFENGQLGLREALTFSQWWDALGRACYEMGMGRLALSLPCRDGSCRTLIWQRSDCSQNKTVRLSVPLKDRRSGGELSAVVDVIVEGSLEAAGRRATLLGRLLDENGLTSLPAAMPDADCAPEPKAVNAVEGSLA